MLLQKLFIIMNLMKHIRGATKLYNMYYQQPQLYRTVLACNNKCQAQQQNIRQLYTPNDAVQKQGSYEGPGKTTVAILNEEYAGVVNLIDSYAVDGFRLNDNTKILGPCVVFPTHVLGEVLALSASCLMILSRLGGGWSRGHHRGVALTLHSSRSEA